MHSSRRRFKYVHVLDAPSLCVVTTEGRDPDGPVHGPFVIAHPSDPNAAGLRIGEPVLVTRRLQGVSTGATYSLFGITERGEPLLREPLTVGYLFLLSNDLYDLGQRVTLFTGRRSPAITPVSQSGGPH